MGVKYKSQTGTALGKQLKSHNIITADAVFMADIVCAQIIRAAGTHTKLAICVQMTWQLGSSNHYLTICAQMTGHLGSSNNNITICVQITGRLGFS